MPDGWQAVARAAILVTLGKLDGAPGRFQLPNKRPLISLQVGHTGYPSGSRFGIQRFPHNAITGTPSTLLRTMSALRT